MTQSEDPTPPEQDRHSASPRSDEEARRPGAGEHDPTQHPSPPGNPETDDEAVAKGEENLGRITGR
jgi:hypothetical protein